MILIFCLSNLHVPLTLSIISRTKGHVVVYTDQKTIAELFERMRLSNVTIYDREANRKISKNKIQTSAIIIRSLFWHRYSVLKEIRQFKPHEIYFFHDAFGTMELWLISKLRKSASVFYCPVLQAAVTSVYGETFHSKLLRLYEKLCWNVDRNITNYGKTRLVLAEKFLSDNSIQKISIPIQFSESIHDEIKTFYHPKGKVILLVEDVFALPSIDLSKYFGVLNEIIKKIGVENVVLKNHPRFPFDLKRVILGDFEEMPSWIPVNLFLDQFSAVIGNWTSVLYEANKYQIRAISLLQIFKTDYDSNLFEGHLRYLSDNDEKHYICYPKTIEELYTCVSGLL